MVSQNKKQKSHKSQRIANKATKNHEGQFLPFPLGNLCHGLLVCEQYITTSNETSVDGILDDFKVSTADLEFLNPGTDLTNLVDGTPVCVVGTSEGTAIGTRPGNLVQYQTSPGADTCMNIVKFVQPPVSIRTFQELNANLNCQTLDFRVGTVFLPNGTTVGNNSDSTR